MAVALTVAAAEDRDLARGWQVELQPAEPLGPGRSPSGLPVHRWPSRNSISEEPNRHDPRRLIDISASPPDGPVLKACGNRRRFIDAGSAAVSAWETVGALLEPPIQDVIETGHGGDRYAATPRRS